MLIQYQYHQRLRGEGTQNVSYIFQGVFEAGLENVSLHVEGILKTVSTRTIPRGRSATFWYGPPFKSSLKGVEIIQYCLTIYKGIMG